MLKSKETSFNRFSSVEEFKFTCLDIIKREGKFIGKNKLAKLIGVPRTSILSKGIDTDEYCREAGFPRDCLKPKGTSENREKYISDLEDQYVEYIRIQGQSTALCKFLRSLGKSWNQVSGPYRYKLDIKKCHERAGIRYMPNHGLDYELLEDKLRSMISSLKRYVSITEFSKVVGKTRTYLSLKEYKEKFDVQKINSEYGYYPNLRSWESWIKEILYRMYEEGDVVCQKSFDDLKVIKKLRYDFYIKSQNLLIEADGPSHYDTNYPYYTEERVRRDKLKNEYAIKNGYNLIRIRYDENLDEISLRKRISGTP